MEFGSSKDGFVEEDQDNEDQVIIGDMGKKLKLPLSSASSASASSFSPSSSPSPSSSHYRYTSSGGVHHHHQQHQQQQQQPSTTDQQQQQQQQHWRGSQIYHHQHPPGDSSSLRFHGGYYEGSNNFSNSSSSNLQHKQHEFMDLSPRNHENMGLVAESDVAVGGSTSGNNNADVICIEREHMFDKVVTPSDVGKLNRLVIPKQHAEKYFPLDSAANEKGLLLSFEDRSGKPWRFRYSYWNSSQSYVMTKGWSRFVKEKKLDAGDIVSFERGANESAKDRLFIDWRRRVNPPDHHHHHLGSLPSLSFHNPLSYPRTVPWGRLLLPQNMTQSMSMPREQHLHLQQLNYYDHQRLASSSSNSSSYGYNMAANPNHPGAVFYLRSSAPQQGHHHGLVQQQGGEVPMVYDSVPVVHGKAAAKRVRLFGVNLDCPISEEDPNTTMAPSSLSPHHYHHHQQQQQQLPPTPLPPHLQLRVYNGAPLPQPPTELPKRGRPSLSFDLDG